ncbi:hypothetical protein EVAR_36921_1 [Eumeta japonica]|uniref:C-type lectin domain-containing protein n=1 Tax=Eumeta variegata TaxID=151549 RepID=A0A4C1X7W6_EUMVA|nr:hypothetical protein EVAR_36921_1 [Eumeta japonica]
MNEQETYHTPTWAAPQLERQSLYADASSIAYAHIHDRDAARFIMIRVAATRTWPPPRTGFKLFCQRCYRVGSKTIQEKKRKTTSQMRRRYENSAMLLEDNSTGPLTGEVSGGPRGKRDKVHKTGMGTSLRGVVLACLACLALTQSDDTCEVDAGTWGALLERWAVGAGASAGREARIMALPASRGYYVTDRVDGPRYDEWPGLTPPPPPLPGKIVNRPPKPKPGYKPGVPQQRPPQYSKPGVADRVDGAGEPPRREVSETDLYLLAAIEKLVYRADLAEKRLRRLEDSLHYLLVGKEAASEPCSVNYTRVGNMCYSFSPEALDWQSASGACRRDRAALLELVEPGARRQLTTALMADPNLRGSDWWTSGLNPGLLWIWSGSARAVLANGTDSATIPGDGRCLALDKNRSGRPKIYEEAELEELLQKDLSPTQNELALTLEVTRQTVSHPLKSLGIIDKQVYDPAARVYSYRGQDCALRQRYVCQQKENQTVVSNEIERVARALRLRYEARNGHVLLNNIPTS